MNRSKKEQHKTRKDEQPKLIRRTKAELWIRDLLSQKCLQDRQLPGVLQGEDNDLPGVVEPRSSSRVELRAVGRDE